jgi:hypothetical protein
MKDLIMDLRPQVLNLVETFKIHDQTLTSSIGNFYGDIYE